MSVDAAHRDAPVALVTMEIRHPATDSLTDSASAMLKDLLVNHLPIHRQAQDATWAMGPSGSPTPTTERFFRYVNRDSTLAASMRSQAVAIETSAYTDFGTLLEVVTRVLDARAEVSPILGVERIGLRYLVELRPSADAEGPVEWADWIAGPLLGPQRITPEGLTLTELQGAAAYQGTQPGKSMIVHYGTGIGQALDPNYYLRRTLPIEPGPFFLLDIDSFWTPVEPTPEYNRNAVLSTLQELRKRAHTAFQQMLSSRLQDDLVIR
jgi:uncharacterized protein (TIGR04255 family)